MKKYKKLLIICFILLVGMFMVKIPIINNISEATTTAYKHIGSKTRSKIVVDTKAKTYTGKKIKPKVIIYRNGEILKKGKHYKVTYSNNKNTGKATITIKGIGEYYGTVKKVFYILPKKPTLNTAKLTEGKKLLISWKKDSKADGYRIYMSKSKNGKYQKIKTIRDKNTTEYIKSGLNQNTAYYFKIRSYKIIDGKLKFSDYSNVIKKTMPPRLYSVKVKDYNKARIHWKKDSKADGYKIYMSTSKNGKYTKIKTIKDKNTTEYVKSRLDPDTYYYFKIRSYKKVKGKYKYSKYSNIVKKELPSRLLSEVTLTANSSGANRNTNIRQASKACNNIVLKPGQRFVWSKVVGPATAAKGYKKATIFVNKKHKTDYGGGICQVSSTVYQAARNCRLKMIERHTHSLPVSYTTIGNDATVAHGSKNLIFENNKSYSIKIEMTSSGKSCTCKIYRI